MSDKKHKLTIYDLPWGTKFKLRYDPARYIHIGSGVFADERPVINEWKDDMEIAFIDDAGGWESVENIRYSDGQWWVSKG